MSQLGHVINNNEFVRGERYTLDSGRWWSHDNKDIV